MLAGLAPALRATRVPPLAAMREGVTIPPRPLPTRRRLIVRFILGLIVVVAIGGATGTALGPILLVIWVARGARLWIRLRRGGERPAKRYRVVPALAHGLGWLVRWRGVTGRLAEENSVRQPGRTMITAAALTIGIALVAFVAVLADGFKATLDRAETRSFAGDLIIENSQNGSEQGIPEAVSVAVRKVPGVAGVTPIAFTIGRVTGSSKNVSITSIEPASFGNVYRVEWEQGSNATLRELGRTGTVVTKAYAKSRHLKVGQMISVLTPTGRHVELQVVGVASDETRLLGDLTISRQLSQAAFGQREDALDFVEYQPGASNEEVQPAVDRLLSASFPQSRSRTAAQFKEDQSKGLDTVLTLIYVLLTLSVIVSLFGIVNTLILSIYERTRELGMLRAIGTTRRQIRQIIRYESLITALIGGVLGLAIGVIGAVLVTTFAISEVGYVQAFPIGTLAILLVAAAVAGLLAAQLPARRAAKLDMLSALASQ
jgi:putative ABC transport system permease protein